MNAGNSSLELVVTSADELSSSHPIWGTGGWVPPERREGLDWLTLSRLLGWEVTIARRDTGSFDIYSSRTDRIVIAGEPDRLGEDNIEKLAFRLSRERCLLVARAGNPGGAFAQWTGVARTSERHLGRSLSWLGPGKEQRWQCRNGIETNTLEFSKDNFVWATIDGTPAIVARRIGRGIVAVLGFHPSSARDSSPAITALLTRLLVSGSLNAVAWLDLEGVMVLRMDDPGGAENVHHRIYSHTKLGSADWSAIGNELRHNEARLSIGYVSGWVDDANTTRGSVTVAGRIPQRMPGTVYPSPLVRYEDIHGTVHDYIDEFQGIEALRHASLAEVELHGYTHMHPDTSAWAEAADRYESAKWYRELGEAALPAIAGRPANRHPLALGMMAFRRFFKTQPTTLICPGEQWTNDSLKCALELGIQLVGSYYLALRDGNRFCWSQHVCAPYFDQSDADWFEAGLPVIGYFHDFDLRRGGIEWFSNHLDRWRSSGAKRFIDYRELAAALSLRLSLEERDSQLHLTVTNDDGPPLVRPLRIAFWLPQGALPSQICVHFDHQEIFLPVETIDKEVGALTLPSKIQRTAQSNQGAVWRG